MTPFLFGSAGHELFGILNPRPAGSAPLCGVVLCNAFGREAIRGHRLYRVLAERLSRAGCDVLRFDYFGTGDSAGEDVEADLDGFGRDLFEAHAELGRRSHVPKTIWAGMRLGATVVQRAAALAPADLARIVMWDPIADGRDYLDLLHARHLVAVADGHVEVGEVAPVFRTRADVYLPEAVGFALSRTFCDQLRALRFIAPPPGARPDVQIIAEPDTPEGREIARLCAAGPGGAQLTQVAHGTDWTSEEDSTGLVPPAVLNLLIAKAGGRA